MFKSFESTPQSVQLTLR